MKIFIFSPQSIYMEIWQCLKIRRSVYVQNRNLYFLTMLVVALTASTDAFAANLDQHINMGPTEREIGMMLDEQVFKNGIEVFNKKNWFPPARCKAYLGGAKDHPTQVRLLTDAKKGYMPIVIRSYLRFQGDGCRGVFRPFVKSQYVGFAVKILPAPANNPKCGKMIVLEKSNIKKLPGIIETNIDKKMKYQICS